MDAVFFVVETSRYNASERAWLNCANLKSIVNATVRVWAWLCCKSLPTGGCPAQRLHIAEAQKLAILSCLYLKISQPYVRVIKTMYTAVRIGHSDHKCKCYNLHIVHGTHQCTTGAL